MDAMDTIVAMDTWHKKRPPSRGVSMASKVSMAAKEPAD
jgi:hypothetical protein